MPLRTRQELKDYCLRRLGAPVIDINVDEQQVEDRIQDALDYWNEYHFDGVERVYLKAEVVASTLTLAFPNAGFILREMVEGQTSGAIAEIWKVNDDNQTIQLKRTIGVFQDGETIVGETTGTTAVLAANNAFIIGNWDLQYFPVSDAVTGIARILSLGPGTSGTSPRNIFDVVYQFRLTDMYDLMATDLIYYTQVKQHLSMLDMLLPGERGLRFNRKQNRLYIDVNWYEILTPGNFIVAECFRIMDPATFPKVYDDIFIKKYATALIKRQWGANLLKFTGIQLPGGVQMNGQSIYDDAVQEIQTLEEEMKLRYEEPPMFMVG
jgi:hypothetical protein